MQNFAVFLPDVPVAGTVGRAQLGPTWPATLPLPRQVLCSQAGIAPALGCTCPSPQFRGVTGWKGGEAPQFSPFIPPVLQDPRHPDPATAQPGGCTVEGRWMRGPAAGWCDSATTHQPCQRVGLPFRKDIRCCFPPGSPINPHDASIYNSKKAPKLPRLPR